MTLANIAFIILLFGVLHGVLFAALLGWRAWRTERPADGLLGALVVAGSLLVLPYLLGFLDVNVLWDRWLFLPLDTGLLLGPLLYGYLRSQTDATYSPSRSDLWHLAPYALYGAYQLAVFFQGHETVFLWLDSVHLPYVRPVYRVFTVISLSVYLLLSLRYYGRYQRWIELEYVDTESVSLAWFRGLLVALSIAIVAIVLLRGLELAGFGPDIAHSWWPLMAVTFAIYYASIAGYAHPPAPFVAFRPGAENLEAPRAEATETLERAARLRHHMMEERPYLRPDLTLADLAEAMGTSRAEISEAINEGEGINFRTYVNRFRVAAVKEALQTSDAEHLTLLAIAMDCGFNSKATFNRVFKQETGETPRTFLIGRDQNG